MLSEFGLWAMLAFWGSAVGGVLLAVAWARSNGGKRADRASLQINPPTAAAQGSIADNKAEASKIMDVDALEKMLAEGQDNAMLRYTLGNLYLKAGEWQTAIQHLVRALRQNKNHSASWKALGKAQASAGLPEQAIESYRQGIEVAQQLGDIQAAKEMRVFMARLEKQR